MMENSTLFHLIQERCDTDEVLDLLGIGVGQLCLKLRKEILRKRERFEDYLEINVEEIEDEEVA